MKKSRNLLIAEFVCAFVFALCGFFFVSYKAGLLLILLAAVLLGAQIYERTKRNKSLIELNDYLNRILSGDESMEIERMEEGELSVLKTNLFKVMTLLMHQREYLKNDKIRLANAIADISHQLKTPLTSIMVMNDLLENESGEEKRKELISTQSVQLEKMNWLIQTLLKISKFDAKCVEIKKEEITAKELIKKVAEPFLITMELKGIRFVNMTDESSLNIDINWSAEALQNIVKNCVEHMKENDSLTITDEETNLYNAITITDTGCGIESEDVGHIFDRFYKGKNSSTESVGIGLALAKTIIEEQRGEVSVTSNVGEGTSFTVKFYKSII
ncbi:MAG: HAMP domain-containing histidine kinase [Lachnospiraceae bacterium]|nr:HAMP domain-containing histidine kinase [Lachnospiraceae bacterium]